MAQASDYTSLITTEHAGKPKFAAMAAAVAQCFADQINVLQSIPAAFDVDTAIGVQLDAVGLWAGIRRQVRTPLNVYFSLDTVGLGFDQGNWQGPFDPGTGLTSLDDETFRTLIRAKIAANSWDGTIPSAAAAYANLFGANGGTPTPVTVTGQQFATGDGATKTFQLSIANQPLLSVQSAAIYRADWQGNQLLYSSARTNLVAGSNDMGGTRWSLASVSATSAVGPAPDGTSATALAKVTVTGAGSPHVMPASSYRPAVPANTNYRCAVVLAQGNAAACQLRVYDGTVATQIATVTLSFTAGVPSVSSQTGTVGTTVVTALANGTYKVAFGFNTGSFTSVCAPLCYPDTSNTTGNYTYFGDAQLEAGTVDTSYIATTTGSATVTDYTLSTTGLVATVLAPAAGAALTWTGTGTPMPTGSFIFIQDNQDMTMTVGVSGAIPGALLRSLFSGGYLPLKPEGVHANYVVPSANNTPLFGFDVQNQFIGGLDTGSWSVTA